MKISEKRHKAFSDFIVFFRNYRMKSLRTFQNLYMKNPKKRYIDFQKIYRLLLLLKSSNSYKKI